MIVRCFSVRIELRFGLLLNALSIIISRFAFLPDSISGFLCGVFIGFGFFLLVVGLIPDITYDKLLYRKWLTCKNV